MTVVVLDRKAVEAIGFALVGRFALQDFCNMSSRVPIYSSGDDDFDATRTNPRVPEHKGDQFGADQRLRASIREW